MHVVYLRRNESRQGKKAAGASAFVGSQDLVPLGSPGGHTELDLRDQQQEQENGCWLSRPHHHWPRAAAGHVLRPRAGKAGGWNLGAASPPLATCTGRGGDEGPRAGPTQRPLHLRPTWTPSCMSSELPLFPVRAQPSVG